MGFYESSQIAVQRFRDMGAEAKITYEVVADRRSFRVRDARLPYIDIDIKRNRNKEYFDIRTDENIQILDLDKSGRHLLLMVKNDKEKSKFLCGHDERQWFTCAIPEKAKVSTVDQAKQALKPQKFIQAEKGVKSKNLHKRHKMTSLGKVHRQGEFFFIPTTFKPPEDGLVVIHHNEPISRGRGRSHFCQNLYRKGGENVLVLNNRIYTETEARQYSRDHRSERPVFQRRMKDAEVWVSGKITHSEHTTLDLGNVWHKVEINTEDQSKASTSVSFLD